MTKKRFSEENALYYQNSSITKNNSYSIYTILYNHLIPYYSIYHCLYHQYNCTIFKNIIFPIVFVIHRNIFCMLHLVLQELDKNLF